MGTTVRVRDVIRALESLQEQSKEVQDRLKGLAAVLEGMNPELVLGESVQGEGNPWTNTYKCILPRPEAPDPAT